MATTSQVSRDETAREERERERERDLWNDCNARAKRVEANRRNVHAIDQNPSACKARGKECWRPERVGAGCSAPGTARPVEARRASECFSHSRSGPSTIRQTTRKQTHTHTQREREHTQMPTFSRGRIANESSRRTSGNSGRYRTWRPSIITAPSDGHRAGGVVSRISEGRSGATGYRPACAPRHSYWTRPPSQSGRALTERREVRHNTFCWRRFCCWPASRCRIPFEDNQPPPASPILSPPDAAGIVVQPVAGAPGFAAAAWRRRWSTPCRKRTCRPIPPPPTRAAIALSARRRPSPPATATRVSIAWQLVRRRRPCRRDGNRPAEVAGAAGERGDAQWRKALVAQPAHVLARRVEGDAPLEQPVKERHPRHRAGDRRLAATAATNCRSRSPRL